jgi:hypothetical protein
MFTIGSWQDVALVATIAATLTGVVASLGTNLYNKHRAQIETQAADQAASDRLIRLIETEADKRVEIVRTEFKLQIAEMQLEHQRELTAMRTDFEKQVKALKKEHDAYRCEHAPVCTWRLKATPPPTAA